MEKENIVKMEQPPLRKQSPYILIRDLPHDDGFLRGKELRWSQTGVETPDATAVLIRKEAESLLKAAEEAKGSDLH